MHTENLGTSVLIGSDCHKLVFRQIIALLAPRRRNTQINIKVHALRYHTEYLILYGKQSQTCVYTCRDYRYLKSYLLRDIFIKINQCYLRSLQIIFIFKIS